MGNSGINETDYLGREGNGIKANEDIELEIKPLKLQIGKCGAMKWDVEFLVANAPEGFKGWVLQKIEYKAIVLPCEVDKGNTFGLSNDNPFSLPEGTQVYAAPAGEYREGWATDGLRKDTWYQGDQRQTANGKRCKGWTFTRASVVVVGGGLDAFKRVKTPPFLMGNFFPFLDALNQPYPAELVLTDNDEKKNGFLKPRSLSNTVDRRMSTHWNCCHGEEDTKVWIGKDRQVPY